MIVAVLGAPGSGKSSLVAGLRVGLSTWTVIDWDCFMPAVGKLTGRDVRRSPDLWKPYAGLVRTAVEVFAANPVALLTVCTPDELADWPIDRWVLLDVDDREREKRMAERSRDEVTMALRDAAAYRQLGLACLDTTGHTVEGVIERLIAMIRDDPAR